MVCFRYISVNTLHTGDDDDDDDDDDDMVRQMETSTQNSAATVHWLCRVGSPFQVKYFTHTGQYCDCMQAVS
jgi:uncharacterized protein YycO